MLLSMIIRLNEQIYRHLLAISFSVGRVSDRGIVPVCHAVRCVLRGRDWHTPPGAPLCGKLRYAIQCVHVRTDILYAESIILVSCVVECSFGWQEGTAWCRAATAPCTRS